jgi:general nucleoside transport system permease protein
MTPTLVARSPARERLNEGVVYLACVAGALIVSAIVVSSTGSSARKVFTALIDGSLRNDGAWGATLNAFAPLLLVATGAVLSNRAGLVNIGQEGQLLLGAIFAAYFGTQVGDGGVGVLLLAFGMAIVGGALWSGIAAGLRFGRGVPEVLSTLLLVYLSGYVLSYGLSRTSLLLDTDPTARQQLNTGTQLTRDTRLPNIDLFGNRFHIGVVVALVAAIGAWLYLSHTVWGFRLRMLGLNPRTAQRAGVPAALAGVVALVVSGGFAGAAGAVMLTGTPDYRITPGFSRGFGWDGLLVALLARDKPIVAIPMAFVFAMLRTGSLYLAATGVASTIVEVVKALLVLALFIPPAIQFVRERRRSLAVTRART